MYDNKVPILVLTPIRNEAWILPHFLTVTSLFADKIIIADQFSTDGSRKIYPLFEKVVMLENENEQFEEKYRQNLLLEAARKIHPGKKIILTLDADEIATPHAVATFQSLEFKKLNSGTALLFEKPDLQEGLLSCLRHRNSPYPMGFVDDDTLSHGGKSIHNIRFPYESCTNRQVFKEPYFLHYSYVRPGHQRAKFRFYTIQEAILGTAPWYRRRRRYRRPNHLLPHHHLEPVQPTWFFPFPIPAIQLEEKSCTWYDEITEKALLDYGSFRFWLDDIWDGNWDKAIKKPPLLVRMLTSLSDTFNR